MNGRTDTCSLTVDVEEWFHSHNLKHLIKEEDWTHCESRVERSTMRILDILGRSNTPATFFILGWVAERNPGLVRTIAEAGHEVASHGYGHELVYSLDPERFNADVTRSKHILEDILGHSVRGYRAPCFSITEWALRILRDVGFEYDSSHFPVVHDRYGRIAADGSGDPIPEVVDGLHEIRISALTILGVALPWGGGGYFRLCPFPLWVWGARRIVRCGMPYVFYIHPWEIDTDRPDVPGLTGMAAFRHNIGLQTCESRLAALSGAFRWRTLGDLVDGTMERKLDPQRARDDDRRAHKVSRCAC